MVFGNALLATLVASDYGIEAVLFAKVGRHVLAEDPADAAVFVRETAEFGGRVRYGRDWVAPQQVAELFGHFFFSRLFVAFYGDGGELESVERGARDVVQVEAVG